MAAKKSAPKDLKYRRIVVKFGTSLLTGGSDHLDPVVMAGLVSQVARVHDLGAKLVVVSSGAIASGRHKLGIAKRVRGIPFRQVMASVGQSRLMYAYEQLFDQHHINVAQALLTRADLSDRSGYLNARNTLLALMELDVVTIVNENDVVAVDEIKGARFGDNDKLSAMVANLVDADLLIILSDIDGLFTADPHHDPSARLIPEVKKIDSKVKDLATGTTGSLGTGGMVTKLEAAKLAAASGVTIVIANGCEKDVIIRLSKGETIGTRFLPTGDKPDSRKRWVLCGLSSKGKLIIDSGAAQAIRKQGSLLPAGVKSVKDRFYRGDVVDIFDSEGSRLACGITNYSSEDLDKIKGAQSRKIAPLLGYDYGPEVVHRNNLAVF